MARYSSSRYSYYAPYVSVAERKAKAAKAVAKLVKKGSIITPLTITGKKITTTFWGNAWCTNLENYSDFSNRMPRGRTYARNGSVVHLAISKGTIEALVQGSELYKLTVTIAPLPAKQWKEFQERSAGKITNLLDLIQGKLPKDILESITNPATGLFPKPKEIKMTCSCPDGARMCKHIAAAMYGVGHRLDQNPELFFTLRSVDMQDLISAVELESQQAIISDDSDFNNSDLSDIFGIDIDVEPEIQPTKSKKPPKKAATKTAKKAIPKKAAPKKEAPKKAATKKPTSKSSIKEVSTKKKPIPKKQAKKKSPRT